MLVKPESRKIHFSVLYLKDLAEKLVVKTFIIHLSKENSSPASICISGSSANQTELRRLPPVAPYVRVYKVLN